jgi:hypothetical protein
MKLSKALAWIVRPWSTGEAACVGDGADAILGGGCRGGAVVQLARTTAQAARARLRLLVVFVI